MGELWDNRVMVNKNNANTEEKSSFERKDEASSQNLNKNSEAINGLPQSTGSELGGDNV